MVRPVRSQIKLQPRIFSLFADRAVDRHLGMSSLPVVNVTRVSVRIWRPSCAIRVVWAPDSLIREALGSSPARSDHLVLFYSSPVFKSKATLCK